MLKEDFIPVAIDQWYTRAQKDAEGEFYQSIARQGPRKDTNATTQGLYVCDAAGKFYGSCNKRNADTLKGILRKALTTFDATAQTEALQQSAADPKYDRSLPEGAVVIQVNTKVLGGIQGNRQRVSEDLSTIDRPRQSLGFGGRDRATEARSRLRVTFPSDCKV